MLGYLNFSVYKLCIKLSMWYKCGRALAGRQGTCLLSLCVVSIIRLIILFPLESTNT